jgi:hypothetical protein
MAPGPGCRLTHVQVQVSTGIVLFLSCFAARTRFRTKLNWRMFYFEHATVDQ